MRAPRRSEPSPQLANLDAAIHTFCGTPTNLLRYRVLNFNYLKDRSRSGTAVDWIIAAPEAVGLHALAHLISAYLPPGASRCLNDASSGTSRSPTGSDEPPCERPRYSGTICERGGGS